MTVTIRPLGVQAERLKRNTGLDHYTINGPVWGGVVQLASISLPVWKFNFEHVVEPEAREHMISVIMGQHGVSRSQAIEYLNSVPQGIPQDHVEITRHE